MTPADRSRLEHPTMRALQQIGAMAMAEGLRLLHEADLTMEPVESELLGLLRELPEKDRQRMLERVRALVESAKEAKARPNRGPAKVLRLVPPARGKRT
jgi:hypothetical protein